MKVERGRRMIGCWWFLFCVGRELDLAFRWGVGGLGWYRFDLALLKMHINPPDGELITGEYYRGFWLSFRFWLPFERTR